MQEGKLSLAQQISLLPIILLLGWKYILLFWKESIIFWLRWQLMMMMQMKMPIMDRIPVRQGEYSENLENESIAVKQVPTWEYVDNSASNMYNMSMMLLVVIMLILYLTLVRVRMSLILQVDKDDDYDKYRLSSLLVDWVVDVPGSAGL